MSRFFRRKFLIFTAVSFLTLPPFCEAAAPHPAPLLTIQRLLPGLFVAPAVDPALPSDYIAASKDSSADVVDGVYWGRPQALKEFFRTGKSKEGIIRVKLSCNVAQASPDRFVGEELIHQDLVQMGYTDVKLVKKWWGDYPLLVVDAILPSYGAVRQAWLGLNQPEGWVLHLSYTEPGTKTFATRSDLAVWERLINQTQSLPDPLSFKAQGLDMQLGVTDLTLGSVRVRAQAEKNSNGEIALLLQPLNDATTVEVKGTALGKMASQWHYGDPMLKVSVAITYRDDTTFQIYDHVISILLKNVDAFSPEIEAKGIKLALL